MQLEVDSQSSLSGDFPLPPDFICSHLHPAGHRHLGPTSPPPYLDTTISTHQPRIPSLRPYSNIDRCHDDVELCNMLVGHPDEIRDIVLILHVVGFPRLSSYTISKPTCIKSL